MAFFSEVNPSMDYVDIQSTLMGSRFVLIDSGVYSLAKTLFLYPNTHIIMKPDSIFKRASNAPIFSSKLSASDTVYNGVHDVYIEGGVLDGDVSGTAYGNMMQFMHSRNINLLNVKFKDTKGSHAVEINSSEHVTLFGCYFLGYIPNKDGSYREAVQIDFANYSALQASTNKAAACYDDTHCKDIFIERCLFDKSEKYDPPVNAIGTHTQTVSENKHENIQIINNTGVGRGVYEGYGLFASIVNMSNVRVQGNILSNYMRIARVSGREIFYNKDGSKVTKSNNTIGCENVEFIDNTYSHPNNDLYKVAGVNVETMAEGVRHKNISFINNKFLMDGVSKYARYILDIKDTDILRVFDNEFVCSLSTPLNISADCTKVDNRNNDKF